MGHYDGFDGFDGDFGDCEGDYGDGFDNGENASSEPFNSGIEWQDWMIIGPMSEDIAEEKKEKDRIYRDAFGDDIFNIGP
jgi:hypothetical protein